jgi:hypothetical protein
MAAPQRSIYWGTASIPVCFQPGELHSSAVIATRAIGDCLTSSSQLLSFVATPRRFHRHNAPGFIYVFAITAHTTTPISLGIAPTVFVAYGLPLATASQYP